ncbi:putative zinc-finger of a C2HC-type [Leishmania shawi]|uniref:Zinc-finger of a C2HC-type n=1 Tax=Leishmania shawi TaxID=5680 RepID=A0AAW3BCE0_9TRYP
MSGSLGTTPRDGAHQTGAGRRKEEGSGLIVTRGLQELLDNERKHLRPKASTPTAAAGGKPKAKGQRRSTGQVPKFIVCYLCGLQFGTASIDIHRPQCYLKRLIAWERGDPAVRGPKPLSPGDHERMMKSRMANAEAAGGLPTGRGYPGAGRMGGGGFGKQAPLGEVELYNRLQMDAFNELSLAPCLNCGRTFLPDRLQIHLRSCRPGKTSKRASAAAHSVTSVATPSVADTSAAPALVKPRPARTAVAYKVPGSAGDDDVSPSAAPSHKPSSNTMSRRSFPEEEEEEGSDGRDSLTNGSPSQNPGHAKSALKIHVLAVHAPSNATAVAKTQDSDESVVRIEVDVEDTDPPSPFADTERRLSPVVMEVAEPNMLGSLVLSRPASMEPSAVLSLPSSSSGADKHANSNGNNGGNYSPSSESKSHSLAADSRPCVHETPSDPSTTGMPEAIEAKQAEDSSGEHLHDTHVEDDAAVRDDPNGGVEGERNSAKTIKLNNVSHFKKVPSRLKLQRQLAEVKFVPCTYCVRTFVPERVQRHEDCCIDRNKPLAARKSEAMLAQPSTGAATPKRPKPTPAAPVGVGSAMGKAKFCGGCGNKVSTPDQKFCTECGHKL